jgi:hypothetical protein
MWTSLAARSRRATTGALIPVPAASWQVYSSLSKRKVKSKNRKSKNDETI